MQRFTSNKIKNITQISLLLALSVVLMILESLIPPIASLPPGVKLGLSNVVIMYALFFLGIRQAVSILLLKTIFVLVTRGGVAFILSLCGGFSSIFIMILLLSLKKVKVSYIIISGVSAISHNMGQLVAVSILLKNTAAFYYSPVLVASGILMGTVTGMTIKIMLPAMERINPAKKL